MDEAEHRGAPDTLTLRARSADYRGSLNSRRDHSYHDTTLEAIVSTVAARNNLQPAVAEAFNGVKVSHIDQTQENDAAFITRLAELNGGVVAIKAGKLLFIKPGAAVTASGKPIPKATLTRSDGDGHTFTLADRDAYTGVSATWLHTKDPKPKKVKVQRKKKEQHLRALQHPAAKKTTTKAQKTPEAKEGEYLAGSDENVFALTTVYATQKAAMRAAQAKWDKLQRGVAEFSISLSRGRADLFPETPVAVAGFKSVIDAQPWIISKVTHNLDGGGFVTTLNLEVLLSDVSYEATESHDAE
ncbi:hypothetical protein SRABI106_01022 [Rahnella aquatilis]|nr:hypothetical protein SRABI106_01022 [Rahnella aquatilis]